MKLISEAISRAMARMKASATGGSRAGFFWRNLTDDRPPWPDRVPVRPSRPEPRVDGQRMVVTWVGHATALVQTNGLNILTDPIWAERASPFTFLGPKRVAEPGISFADLPKIDLVLVSHNHYDHLDLATLKQLWERDQPQIVTGLGNDAILRSLGIGWPPTFLRTDVPPSSNCPIGNQRELANVTAADWGAIVVVQGRCRGKPKIDVVVTRNHHWSSRWFADRNRALWSSFVVRLPGGNLFFAGDTGLGDGRWPAEAARLGPVRLALIPIGAFRFAPGQMASGSHIGPIYAAEVHDRLGASTSIPIHWGTFRLSYEAYRTPPELLRATLRCTRQTGFDPVQIGRPVEVPAIAARPPRPASPRLTPEQLEACLDTPAVRALR